jgi:hypothetical protein
MGGRLTLQPARSDIRAPRVEAFGQRREKGSAHGRATRSAVPRRRSRPGAPQWTKVPLPTTEPWAAAVINSARQAVWACHFDDGIWAPQEITLPEGAVTLLGG